MSGCRAASASQRSSYRRSPVPSSTNVASKPRQLVRQGGQQVEPFLVDQPRDHPDERPSHQRSSVTAARSASRPAASPPPSPPGLTPERLWEVRVARRIPLIVIDSVQDPDQIARRARAGCRRSRIRARASGFPRAYRGLTVVIIRLNTMPALRKLMRPQILQRVGLHQIPSQPESRQPAGVEHALIRQVVNGEDDAAAGQCFVRH